MRANNQNLQAPMSPHAAEEDRFEEILTLIQSARQRAVQAVNTQLIDLYWQVGSYISHKLELAEWGDSVVNQLGATLGSDAAGVEGLHSGELVPDASIL